MVEGNLTKVTGHIGSANVGISNDKGGENPPRRKTKVSSSPFVGGGLVGT